MSGRCFLERYAVPLPPLRGTTTRESYTHKTAAKGKTYYYKVRAVDAKNVKGAFSAMDRIKVK